MPSNSKSGGASPTVCAVLVIDNWTRDPETIPQLTWSDVRNALHGFHPQSYTKAAIKYTSVVQ